MSEHVVRRQGLGGRDERPGEAGRCGVVLFAVGAGGDPERHRPLLSSLAAGGLTVVAPRLPRLASAVPDREALLTRADALSRALDGEVPPDVPVAGVGHSIGAALLLMLAGARAVTRSGEPVEAMPDARVERLVLLAPPMDFFRAPGALDGLDAEIQCWAGTRDDVTPPTQARYLQQALGSRVPVEVRLVEGGGHFSFMHLLPPGAEDSLVDREAFLTELSGEIRRFLVR